ncbi:hypothetical protein [Aeromonas simiae]|uniref:hypothetical protein n=1 Tax=Aeromonas simiae TaxID=218936 RepID=UPI00266BE61C|nr:hypothetical protein [Aeromonas simiae]MDO2950420.1 hypothetical protein [Aeromonas simiae]MDO2953490.1 hypothetical protein [Aeromonas simiae]MDO2957836.1 hypothetical protein [Aeromonas simiae]
MKSSDIERAIVATDAFVTVLQAEELPNWVNRFAQIATYLKEGDVKGALHRYGNTSYGGLGCLSDIYASDQSAFDRAWSECSIALRVLAKKA